MSYVPLIRIEVEGVKHSILQALTDHHDEFTRIAQEEIEALNIEALIRRQIRMVAPRMIQDALDAAVESAMREALHEARFSERMGEIVRASIAGAMKGASDDQPGA